VKANLQKDRPLVIDYISAIIAALLFGCVSTVAKQSVKNAIGFSANLGANAPNYSSLYQLLLE
jgi:hypothetical protein